jgi:hypothetical protein
MSPPRPRHLRADLAIVIAMLVAWLGALGATFVSDGSSEAPSRFAPGVSAAERPLAAPARAASGYLPDRADRADSGATHAGAAR